METILSVLHELFTIETFLIVTIGSLLGVFFGAIPGLNGSICIAILLPITYGLSPANSLLLLGSIYMGSSYGGAISGILINVPGSSEAACTAIEGYQMATKGQGKTALYYAVMSSTFGGSIGVLVLIFFAPLLASFALKFGPREMFFIAVAGLTVVGSLSDKGLLKGIFAVLFGIFLSLIGIDALTGTVRLNFGISQLNSGITLIPAIVGFFAITEMIKQSQSLGVSKTEKNIKLENISPLIVLRKMKNKVLLLLKSTMMGTLIGILPGTGGAISSFVSYAEAKRTSKGGVPFGQGNKDGIIAAESSNNAAVGGSLVPLLALGIPGSATAAIIYGAILIHGILPGPRLFTDQPELAYTFTIGMMFAVIAMGIIGIAGVPLFSKILKIKVEYIIPIVLASSMIGVYSARNSIYDIIIALACGLIGVVFVKYGIPLAPVILGLILGPLVEVNLRHIISIAAARDISIFQYVLSSPISIVLIVLIVFTIYNANKRRV